MGEEIVISIKNVSKCFKRYARPVDRLKEILLPGKTQAEKFWALQDISFEVARGETLGIIGMNGSGKSTLLQMIAGILQPTTGEIAVKGRVSALLELGSGFNLEFTGRQNVFFNGRILGLAQEEIEARFDDIASFADIGDFIDQPVKTYSSGMFVRLAFAVAVNVSPEILIVDEALAVGDVVFQHRCMRRIRELMDSGIATLFVSHDPSAIRTLCNTAILLHKGRLVNVGRPENIMNQYVKMTTDIELELDNRPSEKPSPLSNEQLETTKDFSRARRGSQTVQITNVCLLDKVGATSEHIPTVTFGELAIIRVELQAQTDIAELIVGFFISNKNGVELLGTNTYEENLPLGPLKAGDELTIEFRLIVPLRPDAYSLTVACAENYLVITADWIENALVFQVLPPLNGKRVHSLVYYPVETQVFSSKSLLSNSKLRGSLS
ncbi:MAG: ABC transporter ATP-binding protein [Phormidesmis sp. CAN_BIN44]|nr:ABC transporter ATP-binding protein [Phormidesmis sp. CAN_BIN44]